MANRNTAAPSEVDDVGNLDGMRGGFGPSGKDDDEDLDELESNADLEDKLDSAYAAADTEVPIAEVPIEPSPAAVAQPLGELVELALAVIDPDPNQPRTEVDDDLAASIAANGVLEPITVRVVHEADDRHDDAALRYVIVNGERRYRGAIKAGRTTIPARLVDDDQDAGDRLLHQVVFNDGKRLAPMEEARAWRRIMDAKHWSVAKLATALGKPKTTVSDRIAMLDAPAPFQPLFVSGVLTASAAPILRPFAELPASVVQKVFDLATDNWNWRQAIESGTALSLQAVKSTVEGCLSYPFVAVPKAHVDYTGETFTYRQSLYAVDRNAFFKFAQEKEAAQAKAAGAKPPKAERDGRESQAAADRARRTKAENTRKLRKAQYDAIVAKLPAALDERWVALLFGFAVDEMQQLDQSIACKAIGIPLLSGAAHTFHAAGKAIRDHAAKLVGPSAKLKLLLQLLLATDLQVSEWSGGTGAPRLTAAAKLAGVNLAKVKPPAEEKKNAEPAKTLAPKKPAPKKAAKKPVAKSPEKAVKSKAPAKKGRR